MCAYLRDDAVLFVNGSDPLYVGRTVLYLSCLHGFNGESYLKVLVVQVQRRCVALILIDSVESGDLRGRGQGQVCRVGNH